MRLDAYMAHYWPERTRSQWQKLIESEHVRVNGEYVTKPGFELGEDDEVTVKAPKPPVLDGDIDVIYEDDHVLVMNKPEGILSHAKGVMPDEFTVAEFVRRHLNFTPETNENRAGIVHRLDRATSGVIIAAKDEVAQVMLQKQFQARTTQKTYLAIVRGQPKELSALIDLPIGRNPKRPSSFRVDPNGKAAVTKYRLIGTNGVLSVIELRPVTGRTHQLRVHMAYIGTPIVGDTLYGGGSSPINRLCLHASSLEIMIPPSHHKVFEAPVAAEMKELIDDICA